MLELVMGLGILYGVVFYEFMGISPGGIVAPAYVAVFLDQPARVAGTLIVSLATYGAILLLARWLPLYGRRRTGLTLVAGFLIRWAWAAAVEASIPVAPAAVGFQAIGFIVPGLIANDMERQGVLRTWAGLLVVAALVRLTILALRGVGWL